MSSKDGEATIDSCPDTEIVNGCPPQDCPFSVAEPTVIVCGDPVRRSLRQAAHEPAVSSRIAKL